MVSGKVGGRGVCVFDLVDLDQALLALVTKEIVALVAAGACSSVVFSAHRTLINIAGSDADFKGRDHGVVNVAREARDLAVLTDDSTESKTKAVVVAILDSLTDRLNIEGEFGNYAINRLKKHLITEDNIVNTFVGKGLPTRKTSDIKVLLNDWGEDEAPGVGIKATGSDVLFEVGYWVDPALHLQFTRGDHIVARSS